MLTGPISPDAVRWLVAVWLWLLGAAVGSFLNVVVYRLPAGMSIVRPGSRCPQCLHPIRWFDNLPVVSWIILRGRCRDCRSAISIRYPLVEAGVAALFLTLGTSEIVYGATNLPMRSLGLAGGAVAPERTLPQLSGICAYHLLLLCTLLAAALVAIDGEWPPRRLFLPVLLVGLVAPAAWPWLHPVAAWPSFAEGPLAGLIDGVAGLAAGAVLGGLATALQPRLPGERFPFAAASAGVVLGWQAGAAVVLAAAVAHRVTRLGARQWPWIGRIPLAAWLAAAALAWILAWSHLVPGA
jgi:leader peptidase (prepilin peptidase)/N-methyltransferase